MRAQYLLAVMLAAYVSVTPSYAADKSYSCKNDPRVVEACRWVAGKISMSMRGVFYFSPKGDERTYVVDDETLDEKILCIGPAGVEGEFEFCQFADREVPENRPDVLRNQGLLERWGCLNAWKNARPLVKPAGTCPAL